MVLLCTRQTLLLKMMHSRQRKEEAARLSHAWGCWAGRAHPENSVRAHAPVVEPGVSRRKGGQGEIRLEMCAGCPLVLCRVSTRAFPTGDFTVNLGWWVGTSDASWLGSGLIGLRPAGIGSARAPHVRPWWPGAGWRVQCWTPGKAQVLTH